MKAKDLEKVMDISAVTAVTIYAATHRRAPENQADPIVLKNLITQAEEKLAEHGDKRELKSVLENLQLAFDSIDFAHTSEGLALFVSELGFHKFDLNHSPAEQVSVSTKFTVAELSKSMSKSFEYHLLVLSESPTKLFKGQRDSLTEIKGEFPIEHTGRGGAQGLPTDYGQQTSVIEDEEHRKFFRKVLDGLIETQKTEQLPLFVTGVTRFLAFWSDVAPNQLPLLAIEGSYDFMSEAELAEKTWPIVLEHSREVNRSKVNRLEEARSSKLYAGGFEEVIEMAVAGQVSLLVVSDDETANPYAELAVRRTLETAGEVSFVPAESLSEFAPIAAVLRF
jgi:hypothetical protein